MEAQVNPFVYGRPILREGDLADRDAEKRSLAANARSGQPTILYAPRRYGKTSLGRVVASGLSGDGMPHAYADLWGVNSIPDVIEALGEAFARASRSSGMRRAVGEVLGGIGLEVDLGGVLRVRYDPRGRSEESSRATLRNLLRVPESLARKSGAGRFLLILDEFGEIHNVPGEPDALMRSVFQDSPEVSFLFMGSKKSLLDALFSDRKRPFYNFGQRIRLGRLAADELGDFIETRFEEAGYGIEEEALDLLLDMARGHPYRAQQLAFHAFARLPELSEATAGEDDVFAARERTLEETEPEFRAILDGMSSSRRSTYVALCRDPNGEPTSRDYLRRHGIKSTGSIRSAIQTLQNAGELEEGENARPTDPLLAYWVRERMGKVGD